ncbi:hypothetical protein TRIUR3_24239 [Triticum urartu]|uniref:Uncharacterized protein n=2 Tax=Triticum TaxID=4564 RepID=A0A9R0PZA8_TRITD|nr:hypothetical protein TRIUR3_24239 [Triticum urartu]VAH02019.1 unnamed protein product [Triticum turgidum subsp. durum]
MASMTRETPVARFVDEEEDDLVGDDSGDDGDEVLEVRRRVSRFAVGGDDGENPVDVKARLKVWAQAVALASTTRLGS